ncbi:hypothetical protein BHE74_00015317 [Ensete ventricosum]|uniref:Transmembrane 9 superfamily member n=1 Tax=Ensete ventricosum TaxID=4639 RepID=A0A427A5S4_ENSVE|nr:hypothetical protein B296_00031399 [Ensete ventricosum]RWW76585.1 hypothetical protein BHE74_00015317 [Ensete ventricosum]RZS02035.1 hypothetical protein BHM03_00032004 [Ensete ventricosum]
MQYCLLKLSDLVTFFRQYQNDDHVTLWVNKVGPYNNPQETYNYYILPFCQLPGNAAHKWGGLGEVLGGNQLVDSQIEMKFRSMWSMICLYGVCVVCVYHIFLEGDISMLILLTYNYQYSGFIGETDKTNENQHYLFTHKDIVVKYNGDQVGKFSDVKDLE